MSQFFDTGNSLTGERISQTSTNTPPSPSSHDLLTTNMVVSTTETSNTCPHQCPEGYCIPMHLVCDGTTQCSDNSDEENCQLSTENSNTCPHQCPEGYCIPMHLVCDGTTQCSDNSDEENCQSSTENSNTCPHQCPEGYCIPMHLVCDGTNQCSDNSDETNCQTNTMAPSKTELKPMGNIRIINA